MNKTEYWSCSSGEFRNNIGNLDVPFIFFWSSLTYESDAYYFTICGKEVATNVLTFYFYEALLKGISNWKDIWHYAVYYAQMKITEIATQFIDPETGEIPCSYDDWVEICVDYFPVMMNDGIAGDEVLFLA